VPRCSFAVRRIELHAGEGMAALIADMNGAPGSFLAEGALGPADADGWRGADFAPAIPVSAGTTYWIGEASQDCSYAGPGNALLPYYTASLINGTLLWEGPFMEAWTSRILGCPGE